MVIFVDTSAFLALLDKQDKFHTNAKLRWQIALENQETLISNNYVILETISLVQRRFGMTWIQTFQSKILPLIETKWVDESLHETASALFLQANRRPLSLVDCSSFETMRRLGLDTVFTFDDHFREQGFNVIP
jgi:predicted nucleic acid-binding protein